MKAEADAASRTMDEITRMVVVGLWGLCVGVVVCEGG